MNFDTIDYQFREVDGVSFARFRIDNLSNPHDIERIQKEFEEVVEKGVRKLCIDFKNVRYIGSAALGLLIAMSKLMKSKKGRLALSHTEHIAALLAASRTEKLFELYSSPKDALEHMKEQ